MAIVIPNKLINDKRLTNIDRCILGLIYNCNCDLCYLPQEVIKNKLHFALKNISNSLKKLDNLGFIKYFLVEGKRYKLILCTDYFYEFYKKRETCKATYKEGYHKKEKINTSKEAVKLFNEKFGGIS